VEGHEAGLAKLRASDCKDASTQVHIVAVEGERLAEPQTRGGE
jgi:hypothetical protein